MHYILPGTEEYIAALYQELADLRRLRTFPHIEAAIQNILDRFKTCTTSTTFIYNPNTPQSIQEQM